MAQAYEVAETYGGVSDAAATWTDDTGGSAAFSSFAQAFSQATPAPNDSRILLFYAVRPDRPTKFIHCWLVPSRSL